MRPLASVNPFLADPDAPAKVTYFVDGATRAERERYVARLLADDDLKYLICPDCRGTQTHCDTCGGYGMVCPDCCGARMVAQAMPREDATRYYPHPVVRCPTCNPNGHYDKSLEALAIKRTLEGRTVTNTRDRVQQLRQAAIR